MTFEAFEKARTRSDSLTARTWLRLADPGLSIFSMFRFEMGCRLRLNTGEGTQTSIAIRPFSVSPKVHHSDGRTLLLCVPRTLNNRSGFEMPEETLGTKNG